MSRNRKLAAIMFTDIVGFSTLMGSDEQKTFDILEKNREIHKPIILEFNGQWIKELGDGVIATFDTISDAVNAAKKIMETCNAANDFQLSIGIHSAEVVFEKGDVFGDGVNIAARIESAAPPGCIFISESVYKNIANKKRIDTHFVREEKLKNVTHPVRLYQVLFEGSEWVEPEKAVAIEIEKSIAVLPFVNMSSDPEQEYFSDGISEEIINMLSQVDELKVIGRTSSFAFKGKNMNLKLIGEQLNARYLLEGSVRKGGNKLRITAQLIEASNGFHLYSEKFDRELDDILAIQDEISEAILNAVKIKLIKQKEDEIYKKDTDNVEAYELYLNGRYHVNKFTPEGFLKAIEYFDAAIAIDPKYAMAYADKAFCYMNLRDFGWLEADKCIPEARYAANRSLELDDKIAKSHLAVGRIKLHWDWRIMDAAESFKKAVQINPSNPQGHIQLGFCLVLSGNFEKAIPHSEKAKTIDPFSILNLWYLSAIPFMAGDFEKVAANGKRMIEIAPGFFSSYMVSGLSVLTVKDIERSITFFQKMVDLSPDIYSMFYLGTAYGAAGKNTEAREMIKQMKAAEGSEIHGNYFIGMVHASVGDLNIAYSYFDKALKNKEGQMLWMNIFRHCLPSLFREERTKMLLKRIGVPFIDDF